jgi:hypothetical protein
MNDGPPATRPVVIDPIGLRVRDEYIVEGARRPLIDLFLAKIGAHCVRPYTQRSGRTERIDCGAGLARTRSGLAKAVRLDRNPRGLGRQIVLQRSKQPRPCYGPVPAYAPLGYPHLGGRLGLAEPVKIK